MNFKFTKERVEKISADILMVVCFQKEGEKPTPATLQHIDGGHDLDKIFEGQITQLIQRQKFSGKEGETLLFNTLGKIKAHTILVMGAGPLKKFSSETARRIGGKSTQVANSAKAESVGFILESSKVNDVVTQERLQTFVEGVVLANYRFDNYKTEDEKNPPTLETFFIQAKGNKKPCQGQSLRSLFEKAITIGKTLGDASNFARTLINTPANDLTPTDLGEAAKTLAKKHKNISCTVWGLKQIQSQRMGGILGVSQGSTQPPSFIHLIYTPPKKSKTKIALVGKGITFDSGGLNLKMREQEVMKADMGGAAAVLGIFDAIATLKPNVAVEGFIAASENLPSGSATKPGDILKTRSGKTIEIVNTDAEGRVVLADAVDYAMECKPTYMIDFATLTGGAGFALGEICTPVLGNDKRLVEKILAAGKKAGELSWELPLIQEYKKGYMKGPAHIKNSGSGSLASTICGALFIEDFVKKTKWAHMDIAFTNWADQPGFYYSMEGATGTPVRTMVNFLRDL